MYGFARILPMGFTPYCRVFAVIITLSPKFGDMEFGQGKTYNRFG
jgi:hypothetical protein